MLIGNDSEVILVAFISLEMLKAYFSMDFLIAGACLRLHHLVFPASDGDTGYEVSKLSLTVDVNMQYYF